MAADGRSNMGTGFDDFTPAAHHGASGASGRPRGAHSVGAAARRNRLLLLGLMTDAGWDFYRNEWWHYQLFESRRYPLLADGAAAPTMMR